MFPPLPQAPRPPVAQMGSQGGPPPYVPGLTGQAPNPAATIAEGLDKFMKSYFGSKTALEEHYSQKAQKALNMIQQGLATPETMDTDQVMKWMKKAGWPVRTEAPTPEEAKFFRDQKTYEQQLQAALPAMAANGAVNPGFQMPVPPTAPPPQQPPGGIMERLKSLVGMGQQQRAPVSTQSPTGQYLQQLAQASQAGAPMNPENVQAAGTLEQTKGRIAQLEANIAEKTGVPLHQAGQDVHAQLLGIAQKALSGDPNAIQMAIRGGLLKGVPLDEMAHVAAAVAPKGTPPEEIYNQAGKMVLFGHFGIPAMKLQVEQADKLVERFAGQPDPAAAARQYVSESWAGKQHAVKPSMTLTELKTLTDSNKTMMESFPDMPRSWAENWNMAKLTGDMETQSKIAAMVAKLPRDGTIAQREWQKTHNLAEFSAQSKANVDADQLKLNAIEAALRAKGQEGAEIHDQLNSKDPEVVGKGLERLKNLDWKGSMIKIPLYNPSDPSKPLQYPVSDPVQVIGDSTNWLFKAMGKTSYGTGLAPAESAPVPGQDKPGDVKFPGPPTTQYTLPDPFQGLPPELVNVLQMMSHPKGDLDPAVKKWKDNLRKMQTGQEE